MIDSQPKNVFYSENNWRDIAQKYKLQNSFEVTIREHTFIKPENKDNAFTHNWLLRTAIVAGAFAIFGNLPVQSKLISSNSGDNLLNSKTFQIDTKNIAESSKTQILSDSNSSLEQTISATNADNKISSTIHKQLDESSYPQELTLPPRAIETYVGHTKKDSVRSKWTTYKVKSYDNLTNIFYKLGHQSVLRELQKDDSIKKALKKLVKGSIVRAASDEKGQLSQLVFSNDNLDTYVLSRKANHYVGSWQKDIFEVRQSRAAFTIRNGLFFDAKKMGIANNITQQLVKVFDWDIDFSHDIRVGDKVTIVFEEVFHDGDKINDKNLLAAEFINKGRVFRTIRYTYADGKSDYFTPEGREMKKAFIRTPISHARVSSHFNPGRYHPILHRIKKHEGTDFAARTGTPIMATGNGTVTFRGRKGGYGRMIILSHRDGYTTRYGHMSRFKSNLKVGDKVYQGDIIGYVGRSGRATGPHLHYEFRKNKKAVDPMRVALPNSMSLSSRELQDFRNKAINLVLQLNVLNRFAKAKIDINSAIGG